VDQGRAGEIYKTKQEKVFDGIGLHFDRQEI
jgi:hypothetical protein